MTIKIAFDSFEELVKYANRLKKGSLMELAEAGAELKLSQNTQPEKTGVPQTGEASIPYGRQIAPNFPNANVSQQAAMAVPNAHQSVSAQPAAQSVAQAVSPATQQTVQPSASMPAAVPAVPHEYTKDDLARAAMQLMDKGGMQQLQQLLAGYGCETLQQLPKEQYGNFATALRGLGAQI